MIGTGAIGRQVSLQLAAIGVGTLVLIDFDTVDPENLAAQGFLESDLGRAKVDAVASMCRGINSEILVHGVNESFKRSHFSEFGPGIVFSCVDTMKARKFIWKSVKDRCEMFVDGRMVAEVCRVFTITDEKYHAYYESTLFDDGEAYQGACTAKTTLYCANIAAGFMVSQLTKLYRDMKPDKDIQINILSNEITRAENQSRPAAEDSSEAA